MSSNTGIVVSISRIIRNLFMIIDYERNKVLKRGINFSDLRKFE
jgi:hypothetical protein